MALLIAIGVLIGREYRKREEIDMQVEGLTQQIDELEDSLDDTEDKVKDREKTIYKQAKTITEIKSEMYESDKKLGYWRNRAKDKFKPITLEECTEYADKLEGNSTLCKKALLHSDVQIKDLTYVNLSKDVIIENQENQIDLWEDKYNIVKKRSKKEHRQKIWSNILSGALGLGVGVAVGKASN